MTVSFLSNLPPPFSVKTHLSDHRDRVRFAKNGAACDQHIAAVPYSKFRVVGSYPAIHLDKVFSTVGWPMKKRIADGTVHVTLSLNEAPPG